MTKKDLPTIQIRGKSYVLVKDRVQAFNDAFPNGSIRTELVPSTVDGLFIIKATVISDVKNPEHYATGHSQAVLGGNGVNATAALENAETSAIGRAIALATSIGVIDSIASADEIHKATSTPKATSKSIDPALLPKCPCGRERKYVEAGVSKNGKKYSAFYPCTANREEQTPECRKNIIWEEQAKAIIGAEPSAMPTYDNNFDSPPTDNG